MKTKYIVYIKDREDQWKPNGDGPMGQKTADRIVKELKQMGGVATSIPSDWRAFIWGGKLVNV
jgi:hypothetical protein